MGAPTMTAHVEVNHNGAWEYAATFGAFMYWDFYKEITGLECMERRVPDDASEYIRELAIEYRGDYCCQQYATLGDILKHEWEEHEHRFVRDDLPAIVDMCAGDVDRVRLLLWYW